MSLLLIAFTHPHAKADLVAAIGEGQPVNEFFGVQGQDGWHYGYWVVDAEYNVGSGTDDFVPFAGGAGQGSWNGTTQMWNGLFWDRNTAGASPWTAITNVRMHPNDPTPGPEEYPIIRYLADSDTAATGWVRISGFFRNDELAGDGAEGRVFLNGVQIWSGLSNADVATIPTLEVNIAENDIIDFMLDTGPSYDGADATTYSFAINTVSIPEPGSALPLFAIWCFIASKTRRSRLASC